LGKMASCSSSGWAAYNCFFFSSRRRHTRFDCDWSSDVCSSDLEQPGEVVVAVGADAEPAERRRGHRPEPPQQRALGGQQPGRQRSEERRVGKEGRTPWAGEDQKKNELIQCAIAQGIRASTDPCC